MRPMQVVVAGAVFADRALCLMMEYTTILICTSYILIYNIELIADTMKK